MRRALVGTLAVLVLIGTFVWAPKAISDTATPHTGFVGSGVEGYGDAGNYGGFGGAKLSAPAVGMASTPDGKGYWVVSADGGIFTYGDAGFFGSLGATRIYAPIVGIAATPDGGGYWLVAMDGGIFTYGDARFYGSLGGAPPVHSIVGMAVAPGGLGYWLVGSQGAIYPFGTAVSYGSPANLAHPITGIVATHDGLGYWLVASDGGIFTYGDAGFFGSAANMKINTWVNGMAVTPDQQGYWLVAATGGILTFGDATFEGPSPNNPPFSPTLGMAATPDGAGYWLLRQDEAATAFSNPSPANSPVPGAAAIVAEAASQIGPDPDASQGNYCNPYGPCEAWCSLFTTWVWDQEGYSVPRYPFTGDVFNWSQARGLAQPASAMPVPGEAVMYGTGPNSTSTSVHTGIVAQVWPDGAIDTIEGDAGPEPAGQYSTIVNGPFLPSESQGYNGVGVYGYARP